ncbi:MAG: S46 family peptidase [Gemmataceae bacterium]|nr:S46 family peptidase [Gemmataceae bacterium]MDW8242056.1 S46 family peptidase [Thermogemmata sp.]
MLRASGGWFRGVGAIGRGGGVSRYTVLAVLWLGGTAMLAVSDEGMWLLNEPPRALLQQKYGFDLTEQWLQRAMRASVRLNSGGSGAFVSPEGLLVTNHHVAADALQKLSKPGFDLYHDGFYAVTRDGELKCPDLEINVLQEIVDVTAEVQAAVQPGMTPAQAAAARRAVMSRIEKESLERTGLRSDVVTLYNGALYHLYRYKKYTDVRLVFSPEKAVAGFGGDVDNFEFPRYCLDVAFFRVYENGKPAATPHYFRWSPTGPQQGDLVFVTGHPGATQRLETLARLRHRRDVTLPYTLARLRALEAALLQYSEQHPEKRRQAVADLHSVANARKAFTGQLHGLLTPAILEHKQRQEQELLATARQRGIPTEQAERALATIAQIQEKLRSFEKEYALLESGHAFATPLFVIARHCVRMAEELPKPSAERLREYRDSNLESLQLSLFSPAPLYPELEQTRLRTSLLFMAETLGGDHPAVRLVLAGKNPADRSAELISGTRLFDPQERRRLVEGGAKAIEQSTDSLIQLARSIDPLARQLRQRYETEVEEPERQAYAALAALRFAVYGRSQPPDATFTLRLAFGIVRGYQAEGQQIPWYTTIGQLFARAEALGGREPFTLPPRWQERRRLLDPDTPLNFVSTADTIGGNSGSPVLNRAGELVGINFDRNRYGLVRNFVYTDEQARHIAVHSRAVLEALRKIYPAEPLLNELLRRQ